MAKRFGSASAFKAALEARLRKKSQESGIPFSTLQLKFVSERLLARLFRVEPSPWLLKGGFAMDLRFRPHARTTKDIDLSFRIADPGATPKSSDVRDRLQATADVDLGDHLTYRIGELKAELTNAPQGGGRYPCDAVLLGKIYAKFHIDIGIGDALVGEPEELIGDDVLDFAGIEPMRVLAIPKALQFAEKAHAYSFPWSGRFNTRTKDLVDLVLLIERASLEPAEIRRALDAAFETRKTHQLPESLPPPPAIWARDFPAMAREAGISTMDYREAFAIVEAFWASLAVGGA